jgi:DtxR family transcriptional regulator, Mn-dependent transcriptional regulator
MNLSNTEENYLKALFNMAIETENKEVGTNQLALKLNLKPATVNDMLKKLREKKLVSYEKYGKIKLTNSGKKHAIEIIRKHRLWETFLYEKLNFAWDEIHEIAEQLEHVHSIKLTQKLDQFLGFPKFDPHGDPIPNELGQLPSTFNQTLDTIDINKECKMIAVKENSSSFLQYIVKVGLGMNHTIKIIDKLEYDHSIEIEVNQKRNVISSNVAKNILVVCKNCPQNNKCPQKKCVLTQN